MRIFLKFMNPALWCSFGTSLIVFFGFLASYFCSEADTTARAAIATSLAMQGIMFCVAWGLIIWAMHDREKEGERTRGLYARVQART